MRRAFILAAAVVLVLASMPQARQARPAADADPIKAASDALGAGALKLLKITGFGANFSVGQSPSPTEPWPRVTVKNYELSADYATPALLIEMTREQGAVPPRGGGQPFVGEQRLQQAASGTLAWNVPFAAPAGAAAPTPVENISAARGRPPAPVAQPPQLQPAALAERAQMLWSTPHGFLKAAAENKAVVIRGAGGTEVSFSRLGRRFVGVINASNQVERVRTWVDNPVLGDMLVETVYTNYQKFEEGLSFPMRIVQRSGGHPSLDLWISSVQADPKLTIEVPEAVKTASAPAPPAVQTQTLAPGVYWLTGGSHHSVAVEMRDHAIVVEAPLDEARSLAVIGKVKELIPGKAIRFVVNTHHHFDHAGGLRAFVDEGATVVTHPMNRAFYETAWAAPRTITPDRLSQSKKAATFHTVIDRGVLTDGRRVVELHRIADSPHHDGFLMAYLPAEKILVEADAYTPAPAGAPLPDTVSPTTQNLYRNVQRLKLDVGTIAPLHGARVATLADLATAIFQR